ADNVPFDVGAWIVAGGRDAPELGGQLLIHGAKIVVSKFLKPRVRAQPAVRIAEFPRAALSRFAEGYASVHAKVIYVGSARVVDVLPTDLDREPAFVERERIGSVGYRGINYERIV